MEIIFINERKNKTLSILINWAAWALIIIVIIAILMLFIHGIINFARGRVDYKKLQQLNQENAIIQKELAVIEEEIKSLVANLDSLAQTDTVLKYFGELKPLELVINNRIENSIAKDSTENKNPDQLSLLLDELLLKANNHYKSNKTILNYLVQRENLKESIPSIAPVNGWFMRGFGYTLDPFTNAAKMHEGIDIAAPVGTPIIAPASGVVKKVESTHDFGIIIEIKHSQDLTTIYAHLQNPRVTTGQSVKRGDVIGFVGTSGKITGPHLHYELRIAGVPIDPLNYIIFNKAAHP
ncbi:MAG: M23 family metallopeptidase [bacterium]